MLLVDIWFVIIEYLGPMNLFNLSLGSKELYVVAHKNKKYRKNFSHAKQILDSKNMSDDIYAASEEFLFKLSPQLGFNLCKEKFDWIKKIFFADVKENIYPFVYTTICFFVTVSRPLHVTFVFVPSFGIKMFVICFALNYLSIKILFTLDFEMCFYPVQFLCLFVDSLRILYRLVVFMIFTCR